MTEIRFTIPGKPVGKGRPRFARLPNGKMIAYTPEKTRSWESIVRAAAQDAMGERERFECPVTLTLWLYCEVPASWPAWKQEQAISGGLQPTSRPDLDNCIKLVKDSWNGVVWRDDCQVTMINAAKLYGQNARLEVEIHAYQEMLTAQTTKKPKATAAAAELFPQRAGVRAEER